MGKNFERAYGAVGLSVGVKYPASRPASILNFLFIIWPSFPRTAYIFSCIQPMVPPQRPVAHGNGLKRRFLGRLHKRLR